MGVFFLNTVYIAAHAVPCNKSQVHGVT